MKKGVLIALLAALIMMLGGCQSARKEAPASDRFVGMNLVTIREGIDENRSNPHELDGQYLLAPFAYSDDGEQYTKAVTNGPYSNKNFSYGETDNGKEYTIRVDLYIGDLLIEPGDTLYLEQVYQRADGTFYAVGPGQLIDILSEGTITYGFTDTRTVTGDDGKNESETTSVFVDLNNAPSPT